MTKRSTQWTAKTILVFSLTICVIGAGISARPCSADQTKALRISVLVCDQAGLPRGPLGEARRFASFVFQQAEIEILWLDGEQSSVTEADCILVIHCCFDKLRAPLKQRTVAFAPAGGRHIMVFWDRIRTEAAAGSHPQGLMLGYVLAHELGHLLLPAGYHSPHGIMQERLTYDDWSQARRVGNLFFSEKEASQMHTLLVGRSR